MHTLTVSINGVLKSWQFSDYATGKAAYEKASKIIGNPYRCLTREDGTPVLLHWGAGSPE